MAERLTRRPRRAVAPLCRQRRTRRRGIILPIALMVIGLLAVLAARVVFRSNADVAAMHAAEASLQARLAAEAGIQKALAVLQGCPTCQATDGPTGMDAWYNNPDAFHGVIVQSPENNMGTTVSAGSDTPSAAPSSQNPEVWRFSIVGSDPESEPTTVAVRYGMTDEASKLNLNVASQVQIASLIRLVVHDQTVDADDLAKAIVYYRGVGSTDQTEDSYYQALDPPYAAKRSPYTSIEELLMVRGMTGRVLYGEDWNRNGMLDPEENDGDNSFPPDNGDGVLDRGLYPYLTIWSSEPNLNSRNQQRVNVNSKSAAALASSGLTVDQQAEITRRTQKKSITSLMDLLDPVDGRASAFTSDDLSLILDELTVSKSQTSNGLVNINTASAEVLQAIDFTDQEAQQILTVRAGLSSEDRSSVAWLVEQNVIDASRLRDVIGNITARSYQYRMESVGFADHVGTFSRLEAIVKMQSPLPIPQVVYWRDLSSLGIGWPVRAQED